ncbi:extracellular solute-binding protein [Actinomycetospora sp. CA-084318]|uniref:extracellular solute-binding protein n=1 Tax=Actinomycetospora sp. CA-084318 TaxID=3239892 RepID=UPI003D97E161
MPFPPRRRRPAALALGVTVLSLLALLAGCASGPAGPPTLTWYINPDDGGQAEIAKRCTDAAGGQYRIVTSTLPRDSGDQRQELVRRLAANDASIDIMSLDPPYIPEFAEAGFLAPLPPGVAARVSEGVVPSAIEGASWQGQLVTVPFWANTQLLWYRKSLVADMGLDLSRPVTWDQIIDAAVARGTKVAAQGKRAESLMVWTNALIRSGGGQIITNPGEANPKLVQLGLLDPPALDAARIMRKLATSPAAPPAFSTADEDANSESLQNGEAAFMVNWPFVWSKVTGAAEEGTVGANVPADYGWALFPQTRADLPSAPPYGGINLGVGHSSRYPDLAYAATECITSAQNTAYYFESNGNPSARVASYSDPAVLAKYPMAPVILQSLTLAKPRPQTAYYAEVSGGLQRTFHPPEAIVPGPTNQAAQDLILGVLRKERLL